MWYNNLDCCNCNTTCKGINQQNIQQSCNINCTVGSYDWYKYCLEAIIPCGQSGYAVAYGYYFCNRYYQLENILSFEGQQWRDAVMLCLQEQLLPLINKNPYPSCSVIENTVFDSHSECYTVSNKYKSVCFIPQDWDAIMKITYLGLTSLSGIKQLPSVYAICSATYYNGARQAISFVKMNIIDTYNTVIKSS